MIRALHENSINAYQQLNKQARHEVILRVYFQHPEGLTDREVAKILGFEDMNCVRPRITELVQDKKLKEIGKRRDFVTRIPVRVCRLMKPEENVQPELF